MAENILESYFIRIGALPDTASFHKLGFVLKDSQKIVEGFTLGSAAGFLKFEAVAVGALSAIGLGLIGLADKTAMTDQSYRLLGLRMLMTKDSARAMQQALDVLGATIDEVAYDPELNKRFQDLYERNMKLGQSLNKNFDSANFSIRGLRTEVRQFSNDFEMMLGDTITKVFTSLGYNTGDLNQKVTDLVENFENNLPSISDELSQDIVPVWNDFKVVMFDLADMAKTAAGDFQYLFGTLQGDDSIANQDVSAKSLLKTFDDIINDLTKMILTFDLLGKIGGHSFMAIANSAFAAYEASKAMWLHTGTDEAKKYMSRAADEAVAAAADIRDAATLDKNKDTNNPDFKGINRYNQTHAAESIGARSEVFKRVPMGSFSGSSGSVPQSFGDMRALAANVSAQTGIPANFILDQWAHETGGFSSSVFKSKNNAAGIENADKSYRQYASLEEFASDYARIITSKRYRKEGIQDAKSIDEFAAALKRGGYYEDTYRNYAAGMEKWDSSLNGGDVIIQNQTITIPPGTSPEQGSKIVADGMRQVLKVRDQRTMAQTAGGAFH